MYFLNAWHVLHISFHPGSFRGIIHSTNRSLSARQSSMVSFSVPAFEFTTFTEFPQKNGGIELWIVEPTVERLCTLTSSCQTPGVRVVFQRRTVRPPDESSGADYPSSLLPLYPAMAISLGMWRIPAIQDISAISVSQLASNPLHTDTSTPPLHTNNRCPSKQNICSIPRPKPVYWRQGFFFAPH